MLSLFYSRFVYFWFDDKCRCGLSRVATVPQNSLQSNTVRYSQNSTLVALFMHFQCNRHVSHLKTNKAIKICLQSKKNTSQFQVLFTDDNYFNMKNNILETSWSCKTRLFTNCKIKWTLSFGKINFLFEIIFDDNVDKGEFRFKWIYETQVSTQETK